jgi:hypothetical protein
MFKGPKGSFLLGMLLKLCVVGESFGSWVLGVTVFMHTLRIPTNPEKDMI